jgi:hypothetical protein
MSKTGHIAPQNHTMKLKPGARYLPQTQANNHALHSYDLNQWGKVNYGTTYIEMDDYRGGETFSSKRAPELNFFFKFPEMVFMYYVLGTFLKV